MVGRRQFYKEAVYQELSCPTGNLSSTESARRVALLHDIIIADCDNAKIKVIIYCRLRGAKAMEGVNGVDSLPEPMDDFATANIGHEARGLKRLRAAVDRCC